MRSSATVFFVLLNIVLCLVWTAAKKIKDEDFSEFDDFDEDEFVVETPTPAGSTPAPSRAQSNKPEPSSSDGPPQPSVSKTTTTTKGNQADTNDASVDDEDDDLMFDDEEFETSDSFAPTSSSTSSPPDLKFTEVPLSLTGNRWEAYHCEALMVIALLGYLINFLIGRSKNARLAATFYRSQRDLLERNFALVGDNGQTKSIQPSSNEDTSNPESPPDNMLKESESLYVLWCSGRTTIESMLIELRFIKRQCLFNSLAAIIKSVNDMVVYTIDYSKDDMETFVMCLAKKRCAAKLHRDMNDLSQFCSDRKNADKRGLGVNYQLMSEIGEVSTSLIDHRVVEFVDKFPDALEYIHISDQYTGMKAQNGDQQQSTSGASSNTGNTANGTATAGSAAQQQDALNTSERSVRRVLIVAFNLTARKDRSLYVTTESIGGDYLRLVLHLADRVSAFGFASKDSKMKAIKNRQRVEEVFLKNVYQQRQEQAQQRREDKRRAEKEKIMQMDDPERQRKWEEKEHKREMKRRQPKMKQMKVKAM